MFKSLHIILLFKYNVKGNGFFLIISERQNIAPYHNDARIIYYHVTLYEIDFNEKTVKVHIIVIIIC